MRQRIPQGHQLVMLLLSCTFLIAPLLTTMNSYAEKSVSSVDKLIKSGERTHQQAVKSQQKINSISDDTRSLYAKFQLENKRLEDLNIYNTQMRNQMRRQAAKIKEIQATLKDISVTERQISPLLLRMIRGLEQFIQLDIPFLLDERSSRVINLRSMMNRADVTIAEKFRQVFEAYAIELEYGNSIETYRGTLPGTQKDVEFLRIGRIGLLYQSLDGKEIGSWDPETKQWVEIDNRYRRDVRKGLRMAKKQISPDMVKLPIQTAPEIKQMGAQ
ncbi:MAG: DUF3450 domain-containing protein [Pseudomonadales bacterium]|nr:DUF3450 domain-containing protein [Pseudomonadales bacterium]